jgi:transposase
MNPFQLGLPQGKVTEGRPTQTLLKPLGGFTMYYIGIDVSKKALSLFDGKFNLEFVNQAGLKSLKRYLKKRYKTFKNLGIIFEVTGIYSDHLKAFCIYNQTKTYIINPKQSHHFARSLGQRSKTDKIDARTIYAYQKLIDKEKMQVPVIKQEAKRLSSYLTSYQFALKQRISLSNHIESIQNREPLKLLKQELKRAQRLEDKLLCNIKAYLQGHPKLKEDYQRLLTISGIGEKLAFTLLALFNSYQGTNRAQMTALVGLDPIQRESGTSVKGKDKITKNGNKYVRKMLYMPALSAIKNNQKISVFYQRLIANHKPKKVAVIAAMRKLLLVAHAIYYNKTEYMAI